MISNRIRYCCTDFISSAVSTFADFDFTTMLNDELKQLIVAAQAELNQRSLAGNEDRNVLYNANGIKWTISGSEASSWSTYFTIKTVAENNSQKDVILEIETLTVNG